MKLSTYARDIINKARVNGYASDNFAASDALIKPFGTHEEQKASLKELQQATMGMCWVDSDCKLVPFDSMKFAALQREIGLLQSKIDHNSKVLDKLEAKVAELGLTEFSLSKLKGQIEKKRSQINQIRADEEYELRHKWEAVLKTGGSRADYDNLPEVRVARIKSAEQIEPLELEIKAINANVRALESILSKIQ